MKYIKTTVVSILLFSKHMAHAVSSGYSEFQSGSSLDDAPWVNFLNEIVGALTGKFAFLALVISLIAIGFMYVFQQNKEQNKQKIMGVLAGVVLITGAGQIAALFGVGEGGFLLW